MRRTAVESTLAASVGYDAATSTVEIEFKKGGEVWQYLNVPKSVFLEMMNSDSIGRYFVKNIKGHYPERQVG